MEKSEILTRQAALARLEGIEKVLSMMREELNGLNKRFKNPKVKTPLKNILFAGLLGALLGAGVVIGYLHLL